MKTATVNFKVESDVKQQAQALATVIGIPLGSILNAFLIEFINSNEVYFSHPSVKRTRNIARLAKSFSDEEQEEMFNIIRAMQLKRSFSEVRRSLDGLEVV